MHDYTLVNNEAGLSRCIDILASTSLVALDTEFERRNTFFPKPGLLQLHAAGKSFLLDPLCFESLDPLFEQLAQKKIVMHACREDLEVFRELSAFQLKNFDDTQIAASLLGMPSQISYQVLVEQMLGTRLEKGETCSDWLQRPLTQAQVHYALQDVLYLEEVYVGLLEQLKKKGRLEWFEEEMSTLRGLVAAPNNEDYFFKMKGIGRLDQPQLQVLYDLLVWREELAKEKNVPRGFVIKDKDLIEIVRYFSDKKSIVQNDFYHIHSLPKVVVKKYSQQLIGFILQPKEYEEKQAAIDFIQRELPKASKDISENIKKFRNKKAEQLGIQTEFLLSNKLLSRLLNFFYFECPYLDNDSLKKEKLINILRNWRYQVMKDCLDNLVFPE